MTRWFLLSVLTFGVSCVPDIEAPGSVSGGQNDVDRDGYPAETDCDDNNAWVYPDAPELCDGLDNDCDDDVDEDIPVLYADADGDGFGDENGDTVEACEAEGYSPFPLDCDDEDPNTFPGASEVCDEVDNNCDGNIDEDVSGATWYVDEDNDGYGDPDSQSITSCDEIDGYSLYGTDCDDEDGSIYPGAYDSCDGLDNDCDDLVDEDEGATVSATDDSADYSTINDAISSGAQCITVGPGTYYEVIDFNGKDLVISSTEGAESTIIDGQYEEAPIVSFTSYESNDALLSGFTLQNGNGLSSGSSYTYGGCVYINNATPTLEDLVIQGCQLPEFDSGMSTDGTGTFTNSYGGGIYARPYSTNGESLRVKDVELYNNSAGMGSDIYIQGGYSDSSFRRVWIHDSYASYTGSVYLINDGSEHTFQNIIIDGHENWNGSPIYSQGAQVVLENSIIINSYGYSGVYHYGYYETSSMDIRNTFIGYNDAEYAIYGSNISTRDFSVAYSAFYSPSTNYFYTGSIGGTTPTAENCLTGSNPDFADYDGGDLEDLALDSDSPLIDAGDPSSSYYDTDGSRNDIGAFGGPYATW